MFVIYSHSFDCWVNYVLRDSFTKKVSKDTRKLTLFSFMSPNLFIEVHLALDLYDFIFDWLDFWIGNKGKVWYCFDTIGVLDIERMDIWTLFSWKMVYTTRHLKLTGNPSLLYLSHNSHSTTLVKFSRSRSHFYF